MTICTYPVAAFRAIRVAIHIGYGLLLAVYYPMLARPSQRRIAQRWSAGLLDIMNVSLNLPSEAHFSALRPGLIVANHISWLDVIVLNCVFPMRFVAKSEVRNWPAIGWLSVRVQTLFIERGRARDAARINRQLADLLQEGESLALFPEGTSTDGTQVMRFHASLLQSVIDSQTQLHPVAIRYQDEFGAHSTAACYIDEMSFTASLWNVLCTRNLHVRLLITPPLHAANNDRRSLARLAHTRISDALASMHCPAEHLPDDAHFQSMFGLLLLSKSSDQ